MKLATLKAGGRDGTLVVVSRDLTRCRRVPSIAGTLQRALDEWDALAPLLRQVAAELDHGVSLDSEPKPHAAAQAGPCGASHGNPPAEPFDPALCHSPLPRAYQWADGSAYLNHVELVRKARHAEMPASFYDDPLMYQGGSDAFIGPRDPILALSENHGIDLEAEVAVITGDVPLGASEATCANAMRLLMLVNDVSLRSLIPGELAKGFGFFQSKPASAFSPLALTPDELGAAWRGNKLHLPLSVTINEKPFGTPNAGADMQFNFARLIAHAAATRALCAGSIIGSGTVSNRQGGLQGSRIEDGGVGYCCLAELRMIETIELGAPLTPFLRFGDRVRIEMLDARGATLFGAINQLVARAERYPP